MLQQLALMAKHAKSIRFAVWIFQRLSLSRRISTWRVKYHCSQCSWWRSLTLGAWTNRCSGRPYGSIDLQSPLWHQSLWRGQFFHAVEDYQRLAGAWKVGQSLAVRYGGLETAVRFHWRCSHTAVCACVSAPCFLRGVLKKLKCKLEVNVIHCIALWLSSE